jgi:calcium/proton exchanger cax
MGTEVPGHVLAVEASPPMKQAVLLSYHHYAFLAFTVALWAIGLALHFIGRSAMAEFCVNTLTLVFTSITIRIASSDVLVRLQASRRELLVGLFSTFFETFPELTLATIALLHNDPLLAQTSLTGAFLANCLVCLGLGFLINGWNTEEISYPLLMAQSSSRILFVILTALVLPSMFQLWQQPIGGRAISIGIE